jgi:hypothetical protein
MPTLNRFSVQWQQGQQVPQPWPQALAVAGPVLNVLIEIPDVLAQSFNNNKQSIPTPVSGIALIDTGASITSFDESAVRSLGLNPNGTALVGTAGGQRTQSTFAARFSFPGTAISSFEHPRVLECDLSGQTVMRSQPVIALIGRDFLANCVLVYNGSAGFWSLSL